MKRLGAIFILTLLGTAQAQDRLSSIEVYGLQTLGTPAIAKAAGFNDCKDNYSSYVCTSTKPVAIAGVKAESASVYLDGSDNFSPTKRASNRKVTDFPAEKLTYSGVSLKFNDRQVLINALAADGWLEVSEGRTRTYYKDGVAAIISINRYNVSLEPRTLQDATKRLAELKAQQASKLNAESKSASFIDAMKN